MTAWGYTLKKCIAFFFEPLSVGFLLLFLAFILAFRERRKRLTGVLGVALLWLFVASYYPFSEWLIRPLEAAQRPFAAFEKPVEYIIVLGGGLSRGGDALLPMAARLSPSGLQRFHESLRIHRAYPASKILFMGSAVSGGTSEADLYKALAVQMGVSGDAIETSPAARDTAGEAAEARRIAETRPAVLITTAMHMPRALELFEHEGLKPVPAPVSFATTGSYRWSGFLSVGGLSRTQRALHEYLGRVWLRAVHAVKTYKETP